jgi:hypothetical protein
MNDLILSSIIFERVCVQYIYVFDGLKKCGESFADIVKRRLCSETNNSGQVCLHIETVGMNQLSYVVWYRREKRIDRMKQARLFMLTLRSWGSSLSNERCNNIRRTLIALLRDWVSATRTGWKKYNVKSSSNFWESLCVSELIRSSSEHGEI